MANSSKAKREHEARILRKGQAARHANELADLARDHERQRLNLEDALADYTDHALEAAIATELDELHADAPDAPEVLEAPTVLRTAVSASIVADKAAWAAYHERMLERGWHYVSHLTTLFGNVEVNFDRGPTS